MRIIATLDHRAPYRDMRGSYSSTEHAAWRGRVVRVEGWTRG